MMAQRAGTSPLEFIFACTCCGSTISELFKDQQLHGLHDGTLRPGVVDMLWMADCGHILCRDELPDKLIGFHSETTQPRAICAICKSMGILESRNLYYIRGFELGEYHNAIPKEYFAMPLGQSLETRNDGQEAMRFQFDALIRYAINTTREIHSVQGLLQQARLDIIELQDSIDDIDAYCETEKREKLQLKVMAEEYRLTNSELSQCLSGADELVNLLRDARHTLASERFDTSNIDASLWPFQKHFPNQPRTQATGTPSTTAPYSLPSKTLSSPSFGPRISFVEHLRKESPAGYDAATRPCTMIGYPPINPHVQQVELTRASIHHSLLSTRPPRSSPWPRTRSPARLSVYQSPLPPSFQYFGQSSPTPYPRPPIGPNHPTSRAPSSMSHHRAIYTLAPPSDARPLGRHSSHRQIPVSAQRLARTSSSNTSTKLRATISASIAPTSERRTLPFVTSNQGLSSSSPHRYPRSSSASLPNIHDFTFQPPPTLIKRRRVPSPDVIPLRPSSRDRMPPPRSRAFEMTNTSIRGSTSTTSRGVQRQQGPGRREGRMTTLSAQGRRTIRR